MTRIEKFLSAKESLSIGVPQGSILGPLFFLIYINDLSFYLKLFNYDLYCILFADDTTIYDSHKDLETLILNFKDKISVVTDWTLLNRLTINWSKTKAMVIFPKVKCSKNFSITKLKIDELNSVEFVKEFKLLGVILDEFLSFDKHYLHIKKNVNYRLNSLAKLFLLPYSTRVQFFKTFIQPHFDYCSSLFMYMPKTLLNRFNRFFNVCIFRLLKINIHNMDINDQFNVLNKFNLSPYFIRLLTRFAFFSSKVINGIILKEELSFKFVTHVYNTRGSKETKYQVPKALTLNGKRRLSIFLPKFANVFLVKNTKNEKNDIVFSLKFDHITSFNILSSFNDFINLFRS